MLIHYKGPGNAHFCEKPILFSCCNRNCVTTSPLFIRKVKLKESTTLGERPNHFIWPSSWRVLVTRLHIGTVSYEDLNSLNEQ